jgi:hypothetical protein
MALEFSPTGYPSPPTDALYLGKRIKGGHYNASTGYPSPPPGVHSLLLMSYLLEKAL